MKLSPRVQQHLLSRYGKWAVVTGATSGIGFALAAALADAGMHLIICGRDQERLNKTAARLQRSNVQVVTVAADISESAGTAKIMEVARNVPVGLLINNAGFGTSGLFADASLHAELNMLQVNCAAVATLTHYFVQRFREQRKGGIIFLSSLVAFQGVPYAANYSATKAYIQSFAEGLAAELKPHGIDVLAAAPGPVDSGFAQRANMKMSKSLTPEKVAVPILAALGRKTTVVPGALSKLLVYSLRMVPRFVRIRIMQKVMGGFTSHQRT